MSARVFFVQHDTRFQVHNAEDYGPLEYCLQARVSLNVTAMARDIRAALDSKNFDPKIDYVGVTGPMLAVGLFVALAFELVEDGGSLRLLIFSPMDSKYVERELCTA